MCRQEMTDFCNDCGKMLSSAFASADEAAGSDCSLLGAGIWEIALKSRLGQCRRGIQSQSQYRQCTAFELFCRYFCCLGLAGFSNGRVIFHAFKILLVQTKCFYQCGAFKTPVSAVCIGIFTVRVIPCIFRMIGVPVVIQIIL